MTMKKKLKSISHGRPPTARKPSASLSSKATRTLIRSHHQLHKARAQAVAAKDENSVAEIDRQIAAKGGLESYQLASSKGQSTERGGDSSKVLIEWLDPVLRQLSEEKFKLRMLEVGALSTKNACSMVSGLNVTRIDLHSQEAGILEQDFMERPLPTSDNGRFHIISLSLVLNYVPDPATRGEMLQRTTSFLASKEHMHDIYIKNSLLPCLFLVLPAPCVLNSRYFTEQRLGEIMTCLGYKMARRKLTSKLVFYLWEMDGTPKPGVFKKNILNQGRTRNNFSVTLD